MGHDPGLLRLDMFFLFEPFYYFSDPPSSPILTNLPCGSSHFTASLFRTALDCSPEVVSTHSSVATSLTTFAQWVYLPNSSPVLFLQRLWLSLDWVQYGSFGGRHTSFLIIKVCPQVVSLRPNVKFHSASSFHACFNHTFFSRL